MTPTMMGPEMSPTFKARLARRMLPWLLSIPLALAGAAHAQSRLVAPLAHGDPFPVVPAPPVNPVPPVPPPAPFDPAPIVHDAPAAPVPPVNPAPAMAPGLVEPVRVALMPGARLLVSEYRTQTIKILDQRDLSVQWSLQVAGNPVAVAWGQDRIFVGNETAGRVEAYSFFGRLMTTYGAPGSILLPNAVAIDPESSRVMVLDSFEKVVKVFALDGTFLYPLTQAGALENPSAMSFDAARRLLLVSDFGGFSDNMFGKPSASVRYFDLNGNEQIRFNGVSARPQGLGVDGFGHLYVVDSYESQVQVLDAASGALLGLLGAPGAGPGTLNLPLDVVYSPGTDKLYVTDNQNGRIASFDRWVAP